MFTILSGNYMFIISPFNSSKMRPFHASFNTMLRNNNNNSNNTWNILFIVQTLNSSLPTKKKIQTFHLMYIKIKKQVSNPDL